jgi:hypothetical protein
MRRRIIMQAGLAALAAGSRGRAVQAADTVDLLLVLAIDVSRSIDEEEARLQREGYYQALTDPDVLQAIGSGMVGAIGVIYIEWSGVDWQRVIVPWTRIATAADAEAWVRELSRFPPRSIGTTSLSGAIAFSHRLLADAPWPALRRVIDISGDGDNNSGPPPDEARDRAVEDGIVINGLAIMNDPHANMRMPLDEYFRRHVVGGPGSFVIEVEDFQGFAHAVRRKLILEIASGSGTPSTA